jgi:hypothetical protein
MGLFTVYLPSVLETKRKLKANYEWWHFFKSSVDDGLQSGIFPASRVFH